MAGGARRCEPAGATDTAGLWARGKSLALFVRRRRLSFRKFYAVYDCLEDGVERVIIFRPTEAEKANVFTLRIYDHGVIGIVICIVFYIAIAAMISDVEGFELTAFLCTNNASDKFWR